MKTLNFCGNPKGRCCPIFHLDEETNIITAYEVLPISKAELDSDDFKATEDIAVDVKLFEFPLE